MTSFVYILCTISLAIPYVSHLFVLIFVQYRTVSIAMTRTGSQANETMNLQTPSFKYAFLESKNCRRGQEAKIISVVRNAKMISMWFFLWRSFIFLMYHAPIKTIGYVTDVKEISCWKNPLPSMMSKHSHHLIKLLMLMVNFNRESAYKDTIGLQWNQSYGWLKP